MSIQSRRAVPKVLFLRPRIQSSTCRHRSRSTKNAIHEALKDLGFSDKGKRSDWPLTGPSGEEVKINPHLPKSKNRYAIRHSHELDILRKLEAFKESGSSSSQDLEKPQKRATTTCDPSLKPRRSMEIDRVGNGRYIASGKTGQQDHENVEPVRLPYTTPASEFLYGHGVVKAALGAGRRKFYKMYIYQSPHRQDEERDLDMRKMALQMNIPVERILPDNLRVLDRMSEGRPHNGFVLEASPLPRIPVLGFSRLTRPSDSFLVTLAHQSREDAEVNGTSPRIKYNHAFPRFPFILLLDGVLDPQNLGAILRSAFFLGVDAIALTTNRTAPLSPAALKASAGASEGIPIFTINQTRPFLDECKRNGWKVYVSAPGPTLPESNKRAMHRHLTISTFVSDVSRCPCILILGSEGEGLYKDVRGAADNTISIEGFRQGEMGVDSLNVSVAAALLCEAFLRKPVARNEKLHHSKSDDIDLNARDRLF